jgi:hypothetical protein
MTDLEHGGGGLTTANNIGSDAPSMPSATSKIMRLRYAGRCAACGATLETGTKAEWHKPTKTVTCLTCVETRQAELGVSMPLNPPLVRNRPSRPTPPDQGKAGASARREYERRHQRREQRIDARWGRLAPVAKFLTDDPQSITAWASGSDGERLLAEHLQRVLSDSTVLLHDRKVPGTRGNIDHLAIAPSGVWVIDAKNYKGRVERRDVGGWFKVDYRLYVDGRDRTRLAEGLDWQVNAVKAVIGDVDAPIYAAVCFTDSRWKLFAEPFQIKKVWVSWANALAEMIAAPGPLDQGDITRIATQLGGALRAAAPPVAAP